MSGHCMKLSQSKSFDKEYCARVVHISEFVPHPNPECTRMKCAMVGAYSISVSLDTEPGYFVYFPVGSQINGAYLSHHNLFRKAAMNRDQAVTGFFDDNRKVKPIKLKGYPSEGFIMPYDSLSKWVGEDVGDPVDGFDFDLVGDHILVQRYFVPVIRVSGTGKGRDGSKKVSRLMEGQFRFHYDTNSLERMPWVIKPYNLIHISTKFHGCVEANTIVNTSEGPKTIKEIVDNKLNVLVEAYDVTSHQKVFVPIDDYYTIPNDGEWYEIELEDGRTLKITGNNPIWLPEKECYRKACEVAVGDAVLIS